MEENRWSRAILNGEDFGDFVEISRDGNFRNATTKRIFKLIKKKNSVGCVIRIKDKRVYFCLAKSIAETFVHNPNGYKFYSFKDGNVNNISVDNIIWTESGNLKHFAHKDKKITLSIDEIENIRKHAVKYKRGKSIGDFASEYGVSRYIVKKVLEY